MAKIVIIDDEPGLLFTLQEILEEEGHEVHTFERAQDAWERGERADAVLTDLRMPDTDGLEVLRRMSERAPDVPVVMLTAHGSERAAVEAMKLGAYDYLTKPFEIDHVVHTLGRAVEARRMRREVRRASAERALGKPFLGQAPSMERLRAAIDRISRFHITVLVRGETGTGKELVAGLLHAGSPQANKPLVRFNCAAISPALAESELFGHVKGAFTGATHQHRGYFGMADGGTLVLDEVGELPLGLQVKLLRTLAEGEIQPVGAARTQRVDVRIISCTNRDLRADVESGKFRGDLYYRLSVVELEVPALRERREDIPALVECFRARYAERFGVPDARFDAAQLERWTRAAWPGNVRELESAVARSLAMWDGRGDVTAPTEGAPTPSTFRAQMEAHERRLLRDALAASAGNHSEAARALGMARSTLLDKLSKHGLRET